EKTVDLLPGPALSVPPGRMRPRKPAMTTRPSPQLLSSQRGLHCVMSSIFPEFLDSDSEIRSPSAALFVQIMPMQISQQDMGSAVHQRGHASLNRESAPNQASRGFSRCRAFPVGPKECSPAGYP